MWGFRNFLRNRKISIQCWDLTSQSWYGTTNVTKCIGKPILYGLNDLIFPKTIIVRSYFSIIFMFWNGYASFHIKILPIALFKKKILRTGHFLADGTSVPFPKFPAIEMSSFLTELTSSSTTWVLSCKKVLISDMQPLKFNRHIKPPCGRDTFLDRSIPCSEWGL